MGAPTTENPTKPILAGIIEAPTTRKRIPIEAILELKLKGNSDKDIATLLHCSQQNVSTSIKTRIETSQQNVSARLREYRDEVETLENFKKNRADILAVVQKKLLNSLSDADIKKATAYQRIGMFGILYDKERLERGESTENIHVLTQAISDLQARKWARVEPKKLGRPKKSTNTEA